MASYLGKISAIVSANTAGYVRNLNDAATQTRAFARTIQRDITKSSRDASKSFEAILSPLQRLQRSLEAATSSRNVFAFKGIEGTIQNVKQLRQQVNEIKDLQLAVKLTGASGIDDLRENLKALASTDIQAAVRVTGSEDVDQLQRRLNRFNDKTVRLLLRASGADNVDALAEKVESLDDRELRLAVRAINENAIDGARRKIEQLASASAEIANPLAAAQRQLSGFAAEIQSALLPGFSQVQKAALQLEQDVESGAQVGEERYARLRQVVEQTAAAIAGVGRVDLGSPEALRQFQSQLSAVNETALEIASRQLRVEVASEELGPIRDEIERLSDEIESVPSVRVRLDGDEQFRALQQQVETVKQRLSDVQNNRISITLTDQEAAAEIERLQRELQVLRGQQVEIRARVGGEAREQVDSIQRNLDGLEARRVEIEADIKVNDEDLDRGVKLLDEAAQATRRLAAEQASLRLEIIPDSELRTDLQPDTLQRSAERTASQQVGAGIDPAIRQLDQLAQRVQGVRGQIDSLPATVGSEFIPQLQRAEQEFIRLRSSGRATAEEIENASNNVEQLAAQVRRVGAAQGLGSFADGLDDTALRGAIGSLQALQQILNRVGATAGSDAARQFDRMRAAIQRATRDGTVGSEAFQRELRQISQEAANAAAATGKIGKSAAFREIQRGGDIARGGFDKLSLASQQAAFAIDDFFSATGDLTQKIRAVQNNVTQLAFILGGTTGLFIGLGVAIAAQAAVALFKFFNGTEKATFGAEFLNEALQKQKTLAEETADAFRELGDSVAAAGSGFGASRDSFQINEELRQRRERRQEQADQFVLQTNPRVIQAEAEVRRLEKELEDANGSVTRARVSGQLARARRDLRTTRNQVTSSAASGLGFDGSSVQRSLQRARDAERQSLVIANEPGLRSETLDRLINGESSGDRQRARAQRLDSSAAATPQTAEQAVALVENQIAQLSKAYEELGFFSRTFGDENEKRIRAEIERLEEERGRLQFQAATKVNELLEGLDRTSLVARREIETTLQGLSEIGTDVDITGPLADQIAEQAEQLRQAQQTAQRGTEIGGDAGRELIEEAREQSEAAQEALRETYAQIDALARDVALGAEVSIGQRLGAALDQVGDLGPSIVETSLRRAQAELDQLNRERSRATISDDDARVAEIDAEIEALRQQTAGLEESAIALQAFQSAVEEAALALVDTLVSEARRAAEQSRREANRAVGEGRFDSVAAQEQAEQARQRQRELERQRLELDNQVAQARLEFEEDDPAGRDLTRRIREGRQRANDATLTAQQREAARADAAIAQAELDDRVRNLPAVQQARDEADRQDQERARREAAARRSRDAAGGRAGEIDSQLSSLRRIASGLGDIEGVRELAELEDGIEQVREALKAAADAQGGASDAVKAELDRLEREAARARRRIIEESIAAQQDVLGGFEAQSRAAEQELSRSGVGISSVQGQLTRARTQRESLVARRDAITGEDEASQNRRERLQQEIDAIDEWSEEINASAIAVAGFQDALNEAAL